MQNRVVSTDVTRVGATENAKLENGAQKCYWLICVVLHCPEKVNRHCTIKISNINLLKVKRKKCYFSDSFIFIIYTVRCLRAYFFGRSV